MSEDNIDSRNPPLTNIVLEKMALQAMENDRSFSNLETPELATNIVRSMGELRVNEDAKVRFHFGKMIGYGYDFERKLPEGQDSRETYLNAVKNTKKLRGTPGFEDFISEGIESNRFGWYLTRV